MSLERDEISSEIFERKPYLKIYFPSRPKLCDIIPAKTSGEFYVSYQGMSMASPVSPKTQAARLLTSERFRPNDLVVLFGLGNPHLALEIHQKLRSEQIFICIDSEEELVGSLWDYGLGLILSVPGRHVFCGERALELGMQYLESLPVERMQGLKVIQNSGDTKRNPEFFQNAKSRIQNLFSAKMSDLLTKFEFERIWVKNSLWNLIDSHRQIPVRRNISEFEGLLRGIPGVLVSAGPSLRENLPYLLEIRDKAFFLSCDTSLKALLKGGIVPDGVVTLDAQTNSFFHFMGESLTDIPLFADLVTSPLLLREDQIPFVIHSVTAKFQVHANGEMTREVTAGGEFANDVLGRVGDIQSGGSVATTAFDLLRFLGCDCVHLVGQDLAYTGREIHSTGTHHNEKWLTQIHRKKTLEFINESIIRKRDTRLVESCGGGKVLTDYVLDLYRHWFEESAKSVQEMRVYNWNTNGAKINGFENLPPESGKMLLQKGESHGFQFRQKLNPYKVDGSQGSPEPKGIFLLNKVWEELESLTKYLDSAVNLDELEKKLSQSEYLKRMVRKTDVYLRRHPDLEDSKKIELWKKGLGKEVHFLKRSLYPIKEALESKGWKIESSSYSG